MDGIFFSPSAKSSDLQRRCVQAMQWAYWAKVDKHQEGDLRNTGTKNSMPVQFIPVSEIH